MIYCGIDPGKTGAVSVIEDSNVYVYPMPLNEEQSVDFTEVANILRKHNPDVVYIEAVSSRPMQGSVSVFTFGFSTGGLHGVCHALGIKIVKVSPQKWQKYLMGKEKGVKHTKEMTIEFIKKTYPNVSLMATKRSRKESDGMADSLAIATFGKLLTETVA